jgi:hypothetical protein
MLSSACVAPSKSMATSSSTGALLLDLTFCSKERRACYENFAKKMIVESNDKLFEIIHLMNDACENKRSSFFCGTPCMLYRTRRRGGRVCRSCRLYS